MPTLPKLVTTAVLGAFLSACGGGGDSGTSTPAAAASLRLCIVQMLGDSTMVPVGPALQAALDDRLGAGRASVLMSARSGTTSTDLVTGAAGYAPFPASLTGDVIVANYGINDAWEGRAMPTFEANMRALVDRGVILQTPLPVVPRDVSGYAATARAVGGTVIDAHAWAMAQPDWTSHLPDGVHPDARTSERLAAEVMAPVIATAVRAARSCGPNT